MVSEGVGRVILCNSEQKENANDTQKTFVRDFFQIQTIKKGLEGKENSFYTPRGSGLP